MLSGLGVGIRAHSQSAATCLKLTELPDYKDLDAGSDQMFWCGLLGHALRADLRSTHQSVLKPAEDFACVGAAEVCSQILAGFQSVSEPNRHVIVSSSRGLQEASEAHMQSYGQGSVSPKASPMTTPGRLSQVASSALQARGMSSFVSATCASSLQALMQGSWLMRASVSDSRQEVAVVSSDFSVTPFVVSSLKALGVYAGSPASDDLPYQPWSELNSGMMLGEGSMATILTSKRQGAYAELLSVVSKTETHTSTGLSETFLESVIVNLLQQAGIEVGDVDAYLAHGSGTSRGDAAEKAVFQKLFSDNKTSVKTYKSGFGHLLGGSGLANILMYAAENRLRKNAGESSVKVGVCVSLGFGGQASAVCLRYF